MLELARVLWKNRERAAPLGAHRLVAGPLDRPLCRLDLVRRHVRDRPRRELRGPDQLRQSRLPLGDDVQGRLVDAGDARATCRASSRTCAGLESQGERPHRAGDYSFNNIGISSFFMLSSTMPDELRGREGLLRRRRLRRQHRLAHRERHDRDRRQGHPAARHQGLPAPRCCGVANAEILPFDWRATAKEFVGTLAEVREGGGRHASTSARRPQGPRRVRGGARELLFERSPPRSVKRGRSANAVIMGLARILVPINFTVEPASGMTRRCRCRRCRHSRPPPTSLGWTRHGAALRPCSSRAARTGSWRPCTPRPASSKAPDPRAPGLRRAACPA